MKTKRFAYGVAFVCAGLLLAGVAYGALPFSGADGNTINGCYSASGSLRVLTPEHSECPKGQTPIQWNVSGPQGLPGPQGPQGPQGPPGPSGIGAVYSATNVKYIDTEVENQEELVGVSELPAGEYMVWFTVYINDGTDNLESGNTNAVVCSLRRGSTKLVQALGTFDEESAGSFDRGALDGFAFANVPAGSNLIVFCGKRLGDEPLLHGRIMAARLGA